MKLWPVRRLSQWSAGLTVAFIIMIALKMADLMPLPTPFIGLLGLVGFFTGIVALFRYKEKSLLVWLSVLVGLLIIFWTAAEIIYPH